jgi:hypothetical protein
MPDLAGSGDQGRAGGTVNESSIAPSRWRWAATCADTASRSRTWCSGRSCRSPSAPTSSAARSGNRVAAIYAPLPVGVEDPEEAYRRLHEAMAGLKESGQAVGAQVITQLGDFAPPTILSQAARLQARQRWFNLVVTNVPGPQFPLYVLGHRLQRLYPVVPLAPNQGLGIAIMSYDGRLGFGLLGDFDALADLDDLAGDLEKAIRSLARAAGVRRTFGTRRRTPARAT